VRLLDAVGSGVLKMMLWVAAVVVAGVMLQMRAERCSGERGGRSGSK
jgi:hypothetical protein